MPFGIAALFDRKAILFSPDGRLLAAVSEWGFSIWNLRTGQRTQRISCRIRDLAPWRFAGMADPGFGHIPLKSTARVAGPAGLGPGDNAAAHESLGEKRFFNAFLACSADGKQLILCGKGQDKEPDELCVWDASSGALFRIGRLRAYCRSFSTWPIGPSRRRSAGAIVDFVSDSSSCPGGVVA